MSATTSPSRSASAFITSAGFWYASRAGSSSEAM